MEPIVQLRDVSKMYGLGNTSVHAVRDANLSLWPGQFVLLEGPSGSGKTTLLSMLGLLLKPSGGEIRVRGQDTVPLPESALPSLRANNFGFIFQGFNLFPALTAAENVSIAARLKGASSETSLAKARELLETVGLGERVSSLPEQLSGGQKQRVAIARALAGDPRIILGDEPTGALDSSTGLAIVELLHSLSRQGRSVVVVTHDSRLERFADRIIRVEDGVLQGDVA